MLLTDRYTDELAFNIGTAISAATVTTEDMNAFFATFGLTGGAARRFVEKSVKPMLVQLDAHARPLAAAGLKTFDDLIGREMQQIADALEINLPMRERDYFQIGGGGWTI